MNWIGILLESRSSQSGSRIRKNSDELIGAPKSPPKFDNFGFGRPRPKLDTLATRKFRRSKRLRVQRWLGSTEYHLGLAGDFETHVFDHAIVFGGRLSLCRQIVTDEDAVGDIES